MSIPKSALYQQLRTAGLIPASVAVRLEEIDTTLQQLYQDAEAKAQRIDTLQRDIRALETRLALLELRDNRLGPSPIPVAPSWPPAPFSPWTPPIPWCEVPGTCATPSVLSIPCHTPPSS